MFTAKHFFQVRSGYDTKEVMTVRNPSSIAEMISHCESHSHILLKDRCGHARRVKVNGKVRRWKRDPNRFEVPFKYGLYEYGTLTSADISDVLIQIE